ncbi:MAG TPA: hypothetical protein VIU35_10295 [Chitinophagaceae bacterium]
MKQILKKAGLRFSFGLLICTTFLNAISQTDNSSFNQNEKQDPIKKQNEKTIEISKIGSGKTFVFKPGKKVWVEGENNKGKRKIIKAEITEIGEHQITFTPINKNFKQIIYADSALKYIGFTTTGRVIVAATVTIVLLPVFLIATFIAQTPLFVIIPARKNINFYNTMNGDKKWSLKITAQ